MRLFARRRCKFEVCLWRHIVESVYATRKRKYTYFRVEETFFLREQIMHAASFREVLVLLKVFYFRNCSLPLPFTKPRPNTSRKCGISQTNYNIDLFQQGKRLH